MTYVPYVRHYNPWFVYFLPHFERSKTFFLRSFFHKILTLCTVSVQERFIIKRGLWWRAYGTYNRHWEISQRLIQVHIYVYTNYLNFEINYQLIIEPPLLCTYLSGHLPEIQTGVEVVKIKNPDFSYWAWSTPWGHVLILKSFCRNPVLSWAIRY